MPFRPLGPTAGAKGSRSGFHFFRQSLQLSARLPLPPLSTRSIGSAENSEHETPRFEPRWIYLPSTLCEWVSECEGEYQTCSIRTSTRYGGPGTLLVSPRSDVCSKDPWWRGPFSVKLLIFWSSGFEAHKFSTWISRSFSRPHLLTLQSIHLCVRVWVTV